MALGAIAFGFERHPAGPMARAASGHVHFGGLVQTRLVVERCCLILLKQGRMARFAIALLAHHMSGVIERHVAVLGHEDQLWGSLFLLLSKKAERSGET